jgi:uncharacterized membrane protein YfcA
MDTLTLILLVGAVIFCTFTLEGISGFGSTVLALPFVSMLIGVENAVPLLSSLSIMLALFILCRSWRKVDFKEYGFIVLHVGLGVPIGLTLMDFLPKTWLLGLLVLFMFFTGIKGLWSLRKIACRNTKGFQKAY